MSKLLRIYDSVGSASENSDCINVRDPAAEDEIFIDQVVFREIDRLIPKIVQWAESLSDERIDEKSIEEHMSVPGLPFSLWWLTMIPEKCNQEYEAFWDLIKILAIDIEIERLGPSEITYYGSNNNLFITLRAWEEKYGVRVQASKMCEIEPRKSVPALFSIRKVGPAVLSLVEEVYHHLKSKWIFKVNEKLKSNDRSPSVALVTYASEADLKVGPNNEISSKYWGDLPTLLRDQGYDITWVLLNTNLSKGGRNGLRLIQTKLKNSERERILIVEDVFTIGLAMKALSVFLLVLIKADTLKNRCEFKRKFSLDESKINFFYLFQEVWSRELVSVKGMRNLIKTLCFGRLSESLTYLDFVLFLSEGQSWERSLVGAWKTHQVAPIYGVMHAPQGFGDLKQYSYGGEKLRGGSRTKTMPDGIIGPSTKWKSALVRQGIASEFLFVLEALRFQYLSGRKNSLSSVNGNDYSGVLVVGDVTLNTTTKMLKLLSDSLKYEWFEPCERILFKPHPDCPPVGKVIAALDLGDSFEVTNLPIEKLLPQVRVAFCSSATSVSVEVSWVGKPAIIFKDAEHFIMCPLAGIAKENAVESPEDLARVFRNPKPLNVTEEDICVDKDLIKWSEFLKQSKAKFE
jgi:surface carbohydrate biosynthesis protein (TIGR04326 family)